MKNISKEKIKTWFVTGASSGVGHEICRQLLERGYNVIAVARRIPDFKNDNALCLPVDVTKPETIENAIKKGIERFGKIDVLSNNAGISASIICEDETLEHMKQVMDVNFFGIFNTVKAILPHFRENFNGTIINNSSMNGLSIRRGGSAYCASKHAIEGFNGVCWHETKKFCRVMIFELGYFPGTDIGKNGFQESPIEIYNDIPDFYKRLYCYYENKLSIAVKLIIDRVEKEKLPRRLILGRDAWGKINEEIKQLKKDFKKSKILTAECSPIKIELIIDLVKRFFKKIIRKIKK